MLSTSVSRAGNHAHSGHGMVNGAALSASAANPSDRISRVSGSRSRGDDGSEVTARVSSAELRRRRRAWLYGDVEVSSVCVCIE